MNIHEIHVGSRGGGKSELSRKLMGLTLQQYQEECEKFNILITALIEQRRQQEELRRLVMMSYYEELNEY